MDPATALAWGMAAIKAGAKIMDLADQARAEHRDLTTAELDEVKAIRKASVSNLDDVIASRRNSDNSTDDTPA